MRLAQSAVVRPAKARDATPLDRPVFDLELSYAVTQASKGKLELAVAGVHGVRSPWPKRACVLGTGANRLCCMVAAVVLCAAAVLVTLRRRTCDRERQEQPFGGHQRRLPGDAGAARRHLHRARSGEARPHRAAGAHEDAAAHREAQALFGRACRCRPRAEVHWRVGASAERCFSLLLCVLPPRSP